MVKVAVSDIPLTKWSRSPRLLKKMPTYPGGATLLGLGRARIPSVFLEELCPPPPFFKGKEGSGPQVAKETLE